MTPRRNITSSTQLTLKLSRAIQLISGLKNHKAFLIGWAVFFSCVILIHLAYNSSYFTIQTITCSSVTNEPCPNIINRHLNRLRGEPIWDLDTQKLEAQFLSVLPELIYMDFSVSFPDKIDVEISTAKPIATIHTQNTDRYIVIGSNQRFISQPIEWYPDTHRVLAPPNSFIVGHKVSNPTLIFLLDFLDQADQSGITVASTEIIHSHQINLNLLDDTIAIVSAHISLSRQLTSLQLFFAADTIDSTHQVIDLRHTRPVLRRLN